MAWRKRGWDGAVLWVAFSSVRQPHGRRHDAARVKPGQATAFGGPGDEGPDIAIPLLVDARGGGAERFQIRLVRIRVNLVGSPADSRWYSRWVMAGLARVAATSMASAMARICGADRTRASRSRKA